MGFRFVVSCLVVVARYRKWKVVPIELDIASLKMHAVVEDEMKFSVCGCLHLAGNSLGIFNVVKIRISTP